MLHARSARLPSVTVVAAVVASGLLTAQLRADQPGKGRGQRVLAEPRDTPEVLVFLEAGTDAKRFASDHGLVVKHGLQGDADACVLTAASPEVARRMSQRAAAEPRVRAAYANQRTNHVRMAFVPDDPYSHRNTPSAVAPFRRLLIFAQCRFPVDTGGLC